MSREEHIQEILKQLRASDQGELLRGRYSFWIFLFLLVPTLLVVAWLFRSGEAASFEMRCFGLVLLVLLATPSFLAGLNWRWYVREHEARFQELVIPQILSRYDKSLSYHREEGMLQSAFDELDLFFQNTGSVYRSDHCIRGGIEGVPLSLARVRTGDFSWWNQMQGNTELDFHGLVIVIDHHKNFRGETFVLPDSLEARLGRVGRTMQKPFAPHGTSLTHLDDPEFEKAFVIYSSDEVEARYLLSHSMMERILELRKRFGPMLRLCFQQSYVAIALSTTTKFLDHGSFRPLSDEQRVRRLYSSLHLLLGIVHDLNLTTRIWSKE